MKRHFVLFLLLTGGCLFCSQAGAQVFVIANASVKSTEYTKAEVRDLFTGASSTLKSGAPVTPVLLKQGATHDEFLSRYVGKSDSAFRASWRSLVFSGQGVMPRTVESETAMLEYVAHTAGAVGYLGRSVAHEGVKVLAVR